MIMEAVLYFTVKAACAVYVLSHLWTFIFGRRMYGIWERVNRNHECTENGKENAQKTVTTVHKNQ